MVRIILLTFLLVLQNYPVLADTPIPFTMPATAADRQVHEMLWKSAFKEAMYKNPEQFKRYLFRKDYGRMGEIGENIRTFIGHVDRYVNTHESEIPGPINSRRKFLRELSKDLDAQVGMEAARVRLQEASNQCTDCMEILAQEAYQHRVKRASGAPLTPDEKAADDVVNGLISGGQLPNINSKPQQMLRLANDNEITVYMHEETTKSVLGVLSKYFAQSEHNKEDLAGYFRKIEDELKKMAVDVNGIKRIMEEEAKAQADNRRIAEKRAERERFFVSAEATINLVGSVLRLSNPSEAPRFTKVSSTALSIYKVWADPDSFKKMGKWAMTASTISGVLFIVDQMQNQSPSPENQYVMMALDQIREQLASIEKRLGVIDDRLVRLEFGIDKLSKDTSAQYASLKEHIGLVSNQLTEGVLREWQKDRDDTLNNLHEELRKCRQLLEGDQLDHVEWLYAKQDASEQKSYRECLSAVLSYGDAHARTFAVMNIPNKPLATLPDLELFHKSIEAALPVDLWIPQVTKSVILTDGAVSKDQKSGQLIPAPNLCNELFDAIVWNEAVRAYAELRARVPDFIIDPTTQKNLWKQDQTVRALGKKAQQCLTQQLSPTRFSAVVAQYRQSAVNLVTQLHTLTLGFLTEEYQRLWCNQPIVNSFDGLGTPKSWVIRSCFVAGPSYNASPNGQLTISPETIWYPGSTKIPWLGRLAIVPPDLLLLQQDVKALSASLAKQELLPSAALHMPQGSRTSSDLDALLYGLRGILALRTVLGQIEAPMSVGPPAIITAPSIQSKYDVKMCLARTHTGAIPAVDALKKCGSEVVDGCFAVTDSTPMSIFRYGRVCGGTEYVAWIPEHLNNSETFLHDHMENWSNQSLSTHTTAAMAFRNHGAPPDLTSAECGHPDGLCGGNYVYSLAIHGLAPDGTFSKDGLFKQAYPMRSVPANVDETFTLNQIQSTLEEIAPRFEGLIDNWLGYLDRKDHLLMPYYEDLNRAYIQLKIHTALHLQLSATPSDSVKAFFKAPLSGNDVQKAIKEHQLPPNFSSRLLLTNEDWRVPFPTVSRMRHMSKAMIQKTPCLTTQRSTKYVSYKKRTKAELEEFGDELYCRMWQEITTSEIKRANRQMTSSISPSGTTIFPFAVGSGYLNEGLALLAQLQDMDVIEMAFSRPRGKPQKTVVK